MIQIILQMWSCDQSLVTEAFLREKLSQPQFYKVLTRKTAFFDGWSWFKFNNFELTLGTKLKFYTSVEKGLKLKFRKFWSLILTFVEVEGKTGRGGWGAFCPPVPSWIGLIKQWYFAYYFFLHSDVMCLTWWGYNFFKMSLFLNLLLPKIN